MNKATINAVTEECPRSDCRIYSNGMSNLGQRHWGNMYDRDGNLATMPPEPVTEHVVCATCGASWNVAYSGLANIEVSKRAA